MKDEKEPPKWKKFERLIAAIHKAEQKGANVKWNDEIDGRQFDVTIRFKEGLYEYLTVIECKDYSNSVPVKEVESFVTKSRRVKADKAIMFSASGFQSGAKEVARDEKISLFSLVKLLETSDGDLMEQFSPYICLVYSFRFCLSESNTFVGIPEETGILRSMMRETTIIGNGVNTCPEEIVHQYTKQIKEFVTETPQTLEIQFPDETEVIHMNGLQRDKVKSFLFDYCLIPISNLKSTKGLGIDPYLSGDVYEFTDEINNTSQIIDKSKYQLGFDTEIKAGHYYKNPNLDFSYYCEYVGETQVKMWLIESYQNNGLFQAIGTLPITNTAQFVEVTDKIEIDRLRKMYEQLKETQEGNEKN